MTRPPMHSLLRRQLKRHLGDGVPVPVAWREMVEAVDDAYRAFDDDRAMLERSLELSSRELLQANSEMRAVIQAMPDFLFRLAADGHILEVKTGAIDDLLVTPRQLVGRRVQDLPLGLTPGEIDEALQRVRTEKTIVSLEYPARIKDQEHIFEARLVPLLGDQIIAIVRNITAKVRAAEALRQTELKYRGIFENAVEGMFQSTPDGRFLAANPALADMLGYASPADLIATVQDIPRQMYAEPRQCDECKRVLAAQGVIRGQECQLRRKDGGLIWVSLYIRQVRDATTGSDCFDGMVEDITARRSLEEQIRQSQKMDAFGQLAGGIAHDFNNLLTVIQGNVALLQSTPQSLESVASARQEIAAAADRAADLTRQLLTFSRRRTLKLAPLNLNEVVAQVTRMLQRLIGEHIALETRYAPGAATVQADAGMIEQVLVNLAVNARDAMPRGGRLVVQTSVQSLTEAEAKDHPRRRAGEVVRLSVSDTGTGIAPEHLPHIFEPFFTTKEVGKGTGLGLATVFGIAEQHRGWIEVDSALGVGTTFHLYLPRLYQQVPAVRGSNPVVAPKGTETILLVEDEDPVRELMRRVLRQHGYTVIAAPSAVAALALWREHGGSVQLLVSDMVMPGGINGRELAERLRTERTSLKVLLCTGYTDEMSGADAALRSALNFLDKPFTPTALLQRVRECLDARPDSPTPPVLAG